MASPSEHRPGQTPAGDGSGEKISPPHSPPLPAASPAARSGRRLAKDLCALDLDHVPRPSVDLQLDGRASGHEARAYLRSWYLRRTPAEEVSSAAAAAENDTPVRDQDSELSATDPMVAGNLDHVGEAERDEVNAAAAAGGDNPVISAEESARRWKEFADWVRKDHKKNNFVPRFLRPVTFEQWKKSVSRDVELKNWEANLMGLPKELRVMIWGYALDDAIGKPTVNFSDRDDGEVNKLCEDRVWETNHASHGRMSHNVPARVKTARQTLKRLVTAKHTVTAENPTPDFGEDPDPPMSLTSFGWWTEGEVRYKPLRNLAILLVSRAVSREAAAVLYSKIVLEPMSAVMLHAFFSTIGPVNRAHMRTITVVDPYPMYGIKLDNLRALNAFKLGVGHGLEPPKRLREDILFGAYVDVFDIMFGMPKLQKLTILVDLERYHVWGGAVNTGDNNGDDNGKNDDGNNGDNDDAAYDDTRFLIHGYNPSVARPMPANKHRIIAKRTAIKLAMWTKLAARLPGVEIVLQVGIPPRFNREIANYLRDFEEEESDEEATNAMLDGCENMAKRFGWRFERQMRLEPVADFSE
ncbi:hypothetical protein K490DRAFT_58509 [Saccharata proteae CBS 121410]|uniref:Uncharacterized protein n=1 Tax=Saccharata proteae CBS 121410 TaxID=1314787 RepID=A0A9P4HPR5_9PEZI|nr:hypothetical protein K490DRAFT_58509 [Saccharata proteae CBS 121410]